MEVPEGAEPWAFHYIDTNDPVVQSILASLKDSVDARIKAGYEEISDHVSYKGKSRWEVIKAEVVRINDPVGRGILGV